MVKYPVSNMMVISFNYGLQNEGIKPVKGQRTQRKADSNGKDYLLHGVILPMHI